jgi:hypothetical protein
MKFRELTSLAAIGLVVATPPASALRGRLESTAPLLQGPALLRDGSLGTRALQSTDVTWHGGQVTAHTGEQVTVFVSDSYGADVNGVQGWADFIAGLIHGSELSLLTAYIATPDEVGSLCDGVNVLGCYATNKLVAIGDPVDGVTPQEVVRHEYGHHVAANRINPPWSAINWGTKRWASQASVCSRTVDGTAFPGDEGSHYTLNPGEAFAETYRALNDAQGFGAAIDWTLVDPSFLPNTDALQAVEDDVLHPWSGPTATVVHGRFKTSGSNVWTMSLPLPLDGSLTVDLSFPAGARDHVVLTGEGGTRILARGTPSGASSEKLTFVICGERAAHLVLSRRGRPPAFTLHITRP